jgi:hypothetical protein
MSTSNSHRYQLPTAATSCHLLAAAPATHVVSVHRVDELQLFDR